MKIAVIGAGAVGTSVAYQLAKRGASVTLVDGGDPRRSLSAHSFAWVNPVINGSEAYFALSSAALAAHERLAAEVPGERWWFRTGNLHWADSATGSRRLLTEAEAYRARNYPVRIHRPDEVLRHLEPDLRLDGVAGPLVFYPEDAHVHGDTLLHHVQNACRSLGARIVMHDRVVDVVVDSPQRGVRLASGRSVPADVVVCCAGRGAPELLSRVGAGVPLIEPDDSGVTTRGLLVRTSPAPRGVRVRRVIHAPGLSVRPHRGRRFVLHSHDVDHRLPAAPDTAAAVVLGRLADVVPAASGVTVESAYVGVRPMPRDGMSIVGWLPRADSLYVVVTHSGLTLAPILGEVAAQEILGRPHELAEPFRPGRFSSVTPAPPGAERPSRPAPPAAY